MPKEDEAVIYDPYNDSDEVPIKTGQVSSSAAEHELPASSSTTKTLEPAVAAQAAPAVAARKTKPAKKLPKTSTSQATSPSAEPVPKVTKAPVPVPSDASPSKAPEQMFPPNVLATYMAPMRHQPIHGIPVGSLQLRSYSVRNLEFFADFCMRAAFYLQMPARGPVPLPRQIERWTTLKSNFVMKKAQENFERITYKRLITVLDAEKSAVETWLAFVRKWQYYGVGMKANVWSYEGVNVAANMDKEYETQIKEELEGKLGMYGWNKDMAGKSDVERLLRRSDETRNYMGTPMSTVRRESESGTMKEKNLGIEV